MDDLKKMFDMLSEEEKELFVKNRYGYVFAKAKLFLEIGSTQYLKQDFFDLNAEDFDNQEMEIIKDGCKQILLGRGLTPEKPLENLGIHAFNQMFQIFHFYPTKVRSLKPKLNTFLDIMCLEHVVEGYKIEFYNLIEYK
jgi:hypothetical protein